MFVNIVNKRSRYLLGDFSLLIYCPALFAVDLSDKSRYGKNCI